MRTHEDIAAATVRRRLMQSIERDSSVLVACLNKDQGLKELLMRLESSTDLGRDEGGIYRWVYIEEKDFINVNSGPECKAFDQWLSEENVNWDTVNHCLYGYEGPCILVEKDGNALQDFVWVFDEDTGKEIEIPLEENQDDDLDLACREIEKHMEKTGHFPSVILVNQGEPVRYIDTQKEGKLK